MNKRYSIVLLVMMVGFVWVGVSDAQGSFVRKPAQELLEVIVKKFGTEAAQELAELGGREGVEAVLQRAAKEGGEALLQKVSQYGRAHGVQALRILQRAPVPLVRAFDELPQHMLKPAMWAIERDPDRMTQLIVQYGKRVLEAEVQHPGLGGTFIRQFGEDGFAIAHKVSTDQLMVLARHGSDIAQLPGQVRTNILEAIKRAPGAVVALLNNNPRFTITAATAGTIIAVADQALEKSVEREVRPDGTVIERERAPLELVPDHVFTPVKTIVLALGITLTIALALWCAVHLWTVWQRSQGKLRRVKETTR